MNQIFITETIEQVVKHCKNYLVLQKNLQSPEQALDTAIKEKFGDVDSGEILRQAGINTLNKLREGLLSDFKKNPLIDTTAQGDMFDDVPLRIPSQLLINGEWKPWFKTKVIDGHEYWRARQAAKAVESDKFADAARKSHDDSVRAASEAEKFEIVLQKAQSNGIDPATVMYANYEDQA